MKFSLKVCAPAELAADVLAVSVAADGAFSACLAALDAVSGGFLPRSVMRAISRPRTGHRACL